MPFAAPGLRQHTCVAPLSPLRLVLLSPSVLPQFPVAPNPRDRTHANDKICMAVGDGYNHAMSFKAIIFDCDGVLVDSEALALEECVAHLQSVGIPWTATELVRDFSGFRDDVFRDVIATAFRDHNGRKMPQSFFDELVDLRRQRRDELQCVAGAHETMLTLDRWRQDAAHPFSATQAVASSSRTHYLEAKLRRVDLFHYFDPHIYSADRVSHGKPAPDIFLYTAENLGIKPQDCLVIEDSVHGVAAGLAAGMTVWGLTAGGHSYPGHDEMLARTGAEMVEEDFDSLLTRLEHTYHKTA